MMVEFNSKGCVADSVDLILRYYSLLQQLKLDLPGSLWQQMLLGLVMPRMQWLTRTTCGLQEHLPIPSGVALPLGVATVVGTDHSLHCPPVYLCVSWSLHTLWLGTGGSRYSRAMLYVIVKHGSRTGHSRPDACMFFFIYWIVCHCVLE